MKYLYLVDSKRNRLVQPDGSSVVSFDDMKRAILFGEEDNKCIVITSDQKDAVEVGSYYEKYGKGLGTTEFNMKHPIVNCVDKIKSHDQLELENAILSSPRFGGTEEEYRRIAVELDFIERSESVPLFNDLMNLVDRFKSDNVVWGVGRGSSCACYILYLLEVHDIDSLKFDIPFKEFSKEDSDEDM